MINNQPLNTGIGIYSSCLFESMKKIMGNEICLRSISNKESFTLMSRMFYYTSLFFGLGKNYNLYHFTDPMACFAARRYRPSIVTVHDLVPYLSRTNPELNFAMKFNMRYLNECRRIICISRNTKKDLLRIFDVEQEKISVVYNGVNHETFKPRNRKIARKVLNLPVDKKILLNVGTETPRKNIPTLIRVIKQLDCENLLLIRVGCKSKDSSRLIKSLNLEKNIIYLRPSNKQLPLFYNAADIYVSPSFYEGFGLTILEAMASGCPVIAGNNSSIPEIVGGSGVLLDAFDVNGFSEKIVDLFSNRKVRDKVAKKCYERSKLFSWDKCARETLEVYEDAIKDRD